MSTNQVERCSGITTVVFDYGEVLCHRPSLDEFRRMADVFGLSLDVFLARWEASRGPIDRGDLTPDEYWSNFAEAAQTQLKPEDSKQLQRWEIDMWINADPVMVNWLLKLSAAGIKIGLLSNMPADLAAHVQKHFDWMDKFSFKTFSAHVRAIKPDPEIYQHVLRGLNAQPSETLFVDDREANIHAARSLGMCAIRFRSVAQLRSDLEAMEFRVLPGAAA